MAQDGELPFEIERRFCDDPAAEIARLSAALEAARAAARGAAPGAWMLALDEAALLEDARTRLEQSYCNAESAWLDAVEAYALNFEDAGPFPGAGLFPFRLEDLLEAGRRVLRALIDNS